MGYPTAWSFAEQLPLEQAVRAHFESNCYPPINSAFIQLAMAAITHAADGDWTTLLTTPGAQQITVAAAVEHFHLEAFVDYLTATRSGRES